MAEHMGDDDLSITSVIDNDYLASATTWTSNNTWASDNTWAIQTALPEENNTLTLNSDGTATFENEIEINGLGVAERLAIIESVLGIPTRDAEMEKKYPHLKSIHDECVKKITSALTSQEYTKEVEKLRTFEILKTDNTDGTNSP